MSVAGANGKVNVVIAGATGAVGGALIEILEEREFPVDRLHLLASERSCGKRPAIPRQVGPGAKAR